jgi:acyl carrier protein
MTKDSLRARTLHSIAEVLEIEESELRGSDRIREDLGMDSLGRLELLSILSESLRIDLEVDHAMKIVTVDDA